MGRLMEDESVKTIDRLERELAQAVQDKTFWRDAYYEETVRQTGLVPFTIGAIVAGLTAFAYIRIAG